MNSIFLCDVDGVLADTHTAWLGLYNQASGDHLKPEMIASWDISKFVLPGWKEKIWEIFENPDLYSYVLPIEGALTGVLKLREHGWKIVFVTSPSNGENPMRRYAWLKEHGFTTAMSDFVVARDKALLRGEMILDDNPNTIVKYPGFGIMFDQPWNRNTEWNRRARDWNDVLKMVNC